MFSVHDREGQRERRGEGGERKRGGEGLGGEGRGEREITKFPKRFQEDPRLLLELRLPEDISCSASGSSSQKLQNILFPVPKCRWRRETLPAAGPRSRWGAAAAADR